MNAQKLLFLGPFDSDFIKKVWRYFTHIRVDSTVFRPYWIQPKLSLATFLKNF